MPYIGRPPTRFCCREHAIEYQVAEHKQALDWFRACGMPVRIEREQPEQQTARVA